jgi:hypothetical protein
MSVTNDGLIGLRSQNWSEINRILSNESNCREMNEDPIFQIFESNLVNEIKRLDIKDTFDLPQLVLVRLFQLSTRNRLINLSEKCIVEIADYLFNKEPSEEYARLLLNNKKAIDFLQNKNKEADRAISNTTIAANLHVRVGAKGEIIYSKKITNSPQEEELFVIARKLFPNKLVYPNIALSVIIDDKILTELASEQIPFFFRSTIDLCIINTHTLIPEYYFELDSSWHDRPKQIERDIIKNQIFNKAGLTLIRIRKKENKTMKDVFELLLEKYASNIDS